MFWILICINGYFDIETYTDENGKITPYCIIFKINNSYSIFYDKVEDQLMSFLSSISKTSAFYAHNLSFDGWLILEIITKKLKKSISISLIKNDKKFYQIAINFNTHKIFFKCTYLFLISSLKNLSYSYNLNIKKGSMPYKFVTKETLYYKGDKPLSKFFIDHKSWKDANPFFDLKEETIAYCINDIDIAQKCFEIFKNHILEYFNIDIDKESVTSLSSLSMKIFLSRYNDFNVKLTIENDSYARLSYHGGRCENVGNPTKDETVIGHYDVKQMYPNIMKGLFPKNKESFIKDPIKIKNGFYKVGFYSNIKFPVLPIRGDKLYFPNGNYEGVYYSGEIEYAQSKGVEIKKIIDGVEYGENVEKPFARFQEELIKMRDTARSNGNEALATTFKNIANSLYGKMGASDGDFLFELVETSWILKNKWLCPKEFMRMSEINNYTLFSKKSETKSNVMYASIITSRGRILLHRCISEVLKNKGRILYYDTDSVYAAFKEPIEYSKYELINWKQSDSHLLKDIVICAPKVYGVLNFDGSYKTFKKGFASNISFNDMKDFYYNNKTLSSTEFQVFKKDWALYNSAGIKKMTSLSTNKRIFLDKYHSKPLWDVHIS